jgi:hypothetical protein
MVGLVALVRLRSIPTPALSVGTARQGKSGQGVLVVPPLTTVLSLFLSFRFHTDINREQFRVL